MTLAKREGILSTHMADLLKTAYLNSMGQHSTVLTAIMDIDTPTNISDLKRFMGMVNQLGKFSPCTDCLTLQAPKRAFEHQVCLVMGIRPGRCLCQSQGRDGHTLHISYE